MANLPFQLAVCPAGVPQEEAISRCRAVGVNDPQFIKGTRHEQPIADLHRILFFPIAPEENRAVVHLDRAAHVNLVFEEILESGCVLQEAAQLYLQRAVHDESQ